MGALGSRLWALGTKFGFLKLRLGSIMELRVGSPLPSSVALGTRLGPFGTKLGVSGAKVKSSGAKIRGCGTEIGVSEPQLPNSWPRSSKSWPQGPCS